MDLGRVILRPSMSVRLLILDAKSGRPISGARVALAGEPAVATSGRDGTALLDGIGRNENADVEASAAGYLPATAHLQNGLKQPAVIRMTAGATIVARVVGRNDQRPEGPGTLFIDLAGTKKIEHFGADGIVRIGGLSPGKLNIDVRVPGFASRKLPQRELVTGESVDFGTVALPAGYAISGTVVDAMTSAPLQAHVRVPRPNPSGALLSVVMKDWIEAATDDAGQFQLTGLAAGDYRLLVESPGFAPALTERVTVGADQKDTDVGVVRLSAGRRLVIACRPARRCGSKAELLLGDPNDDWATISAPVNDGRGEILAAPPGTHDLRLLDRGAIVAEQDVDILEDAPESTAEIVLRQTHVTGQVSRGGRPVENGSVQFIEQTTGSSLPIFMSRDLEAEKVDSDIIGVVPRSIVVSVDDRGSFASDDLGAGTYSVSYSGANGASPKQVVTIPDASAYTVNIDLRAAILRGHIVDEDGKVPDWARVEIKAGSTLVSGDMMPDGTYAIDGAPPGMATVHAYDNTSEAERETAIEEDGETDVDLTLHPKPQKRITITAIGPTGVPVEGANVFLLCDGTLKTSRADVKGSVSFDLGVATDVCIPAAFSSANGWTFGAPVSLSSDSEPTESSLQFSQHDVALVIRTQTAAAFAISASNGFPLDRAFPFIGWPAVADRSEPLTLRGFPPGTYLFQGKGTSQSVVIDGTDDVLVTF
ncbi:MAG TPA: carboxypeptidase-like regulatory domain-containing protein [Thermoanaerobaculia bacterium]|nr:carboxypeptidase-like regulatory domain-containing protein [Thermoanaerobaculia bacterium]